MNSAALPLPNDPVQLKAEVVQLRDIVEEKKQRIEQLLDCILLLRRRQFGPSSEQFNIDQINLFDEAELEQLLGDLDLPADPDEVTAPAQEQAGPDKRTPKRRPLPEHLNRIEKIIDFSDEEKAAMDGKWTFIGYETSEQLAVIPRQHYVIIFKRAKYVAKDADVDGAEQGVIIAPRADQIIPKSIAHSSVIADIVTRKFVDGLPLYRQEKIYARDGIELSRQTMSGLVIQLHEKLTPLMEAMKKILYQGDVLHIDETRLQVLNEPGKENTQLSYIWVYVGGPPDKPVVWHQYADSRGGHVPIEFLYPDGSGDVIDPEWSFTIMTDGYSGYNALSGMPGIKWHAACWAHARRKFVEASAGRKNQAAAHQMVAMIAKLYLIERGAKDMSPGERWEIRQTQAKPLLEKIKAWLDEKAGKVLPKSLLGKAIRYALNLWPQLTVYLEDGNIPIDNNRAENAIRPFVIGRRNWLFSGSPRGAHASATLYSLIETAKANQLEPWAYLNYLFEKLPTAKSEQALLALLPQNLKMEDLGS